MNPERLKAIEKGAKEVKDEQINQITPLEAALIYARKGWCVFVRPGKSAYKGTHGQKDATTEPDKIKKMWTEHPAGNVAIATGKCSNLIVLDVDNEQSFNQLLKDFEKVWPNQIPYVSSPTEGHYHFYFKYPESKIRVSKSFMENYPGLEFKSDGGSITAPPSFNDQGQYKWEFISEPKDIPQELLNLLTKVEDKVVNEEITIPEGRRNIQLTRIAGFYHNLGWNEEQLTNQLLGDNQRFCKPPLGEQEVRNIAHSIHQTSCGYNFSLTDMGNAELFTWLHSTEVKYCDTQKAWCIWDGYRWKKDDIKGAQEIMKKTILQMKIAAENILDEEQRKKVLVWVYKSQNEQRITDALKVASSDPEIAITMDKFDTQGYLLNCLNGTINLKTKEIKQHNPEDFISKIISIEYKPDVRDDIWEYFLNQISNGDKELLYFLQKAVGYSTTTSTEEKVLFYIYGPPNTGKTSFLESICRVLQDYSTSAPLITFLRQKSLSGPSPEIARLEGRRIVVGGEVNKGQRMNEALIKRLTGGDTITARFLYKEYREFKHVPKIWLMGNDVLTIDDRDDAMWDRIRRIPFDHQVTDQDKTPAIKEYLLEYEDPKPSILAWIVEGAYLWYKEGLGVVPQRVKESTDAYRREMNVMQNFYDECCFFEYNQECSVKYLWETYYTWCDKNKISPISQREFNSRLEEKGCHRDRAWREHRGEKKTLVIWKGISLRDDEDSS